MERGSPGPGRCHTPKDTPSFGRLKPALPRTKSTKNELTWEEPKVQGQHDLGLALARAVGRRWRQRSHCETHRKKARPRGVSRRQLPVRGAAPPRGE